jgi:Carboxypeptidase regulatory-like domain
MKRPLLISLAVLLLSVTAPGQTRGSLQSGRTNTILTGTVYDINGSVIVLSRVVAYSLDGKEYDATTNDEGIYKIQVPSAVYTVVATAPGFCLKRISHFRVVKAASGKMSLDMVLEVADERKPCAIESMPSRKSEKKPQRRPKAIAE